MRRPVPKDLRPTGHLKGRDGEKPPWDVQELGTSPRPPSPPAWAPPVVPRAAPRTTGIAFPIPVAPASPRFSPPRDGTTSNQRQRGGKQQGPPGQRPPERSGGDPVSGRGKIERGGSQPPPHLHPIGFIPGVQLAQQGMAAGAFLPPLPAVPAAEQGPDSP
ncbi:proline-rich protein HaeIII subfamily 1-like [Cinclus cinclus]|uniref:proline-rich protein HaeIII subfamily 1-like n=1 Tax=Cinclus cinclus TaxID=127875 RepID=UPI002E10732A